MRTSRGFWRVVGAMQSRKIPDSARCGIKRCECPPTHVILSVNGRNYACDAHAEQGKSLGYEVFKGSTPESNTNG